MSEYQAQKIELTASATEPRQRVLAGLEAVRAKALPVTIGAVAAIAVHAGMGALPPDTALRVAAAFAGSAAWLYLVFTSRMGIALAIGNVASVAGLFTVAVLSLSHAWALPAAFAGHAMWSAVLADRSGAWWAWCAWHTTLAALLRLG